MYACMYFKGSSAEANNYPISYYGTEYAFSSMSTRPPPAIAEVRNFALYEMSPLEDRIRQLEGASAAG